METIQFFKENNKNLNTTKSTKSWYHKYCDWATESGYQHNIEDLDAPTLNVIYIGEIFFRD